MTCEGQHSATLAIRGGGPEPAGRGDSSNVGSLGIFRLKRPHHRLIWTAIIGGGLYSVYIGHVTWLTQCT